MGLCCFSRCWVCSSRNGLNNNISSPLFNCNGGEVLIDMNRMLEVIRQINHTKITSFKRYKQNVSYLEVYLSKYGISYPPDWIALVLGIIFFGLITIGISAETPIYYGEALTFNIERLVGFIVLLTIITNVLSSLYVETKSSLILDQIAISRIKKYIVQIGVEIYSITLIIPVTILLLLPFFISSYNLTSDIFVNSEILIIVAISYLIAATISVLILNISRIVVIPKISKNIYRLISLLLIVAVNYYGIPKISFTIINSIIDIIIALTLVLILIFSSGYYLHRNRKQC